MDLKIKDVAKLLNVSEDTVLLWSSQGKIPSYKLNDQYRFSLMEIENWMMEKRVHGEEIKEETLTTKGGLQQFNLFRAINRGGVISFHAEDKTEAIVKGASVAAKKLALDEEVLADLLLDREQMMTTALNHGIAVPHTRDFVLQQPLDMVLVAFLEKPIEFGALDGEPVHTLFFIFSSEDKRHLNLLSKLAHLSSSDKMLEFLKSAPAEDKLLETVKDWESGLTHASV